MKQVSLWVLVAVAAIMGFKAADADSLPTRQVIGGDLLYTVQASGRTESEALNAAETRAVHYLSVECSVPPKEARVYHQQSEHTESGIRARVQVGVAIEDCEIARNAPLSRKKFLANLAWLPAEAPVSRSVAAAPEAYRFTEAQLRSHERAIEKKAAAREAERQKIKASFGG
jgi:hypothetical protein